MGVSHLVRIRLVRIKRPVWTKITCTEATLKNSWVSCLPKKKNLNRIFNILFQYQVTTVSIQKEENNLKDFFSARLVGLYPNKPTEQETNLYRGWPELHALTNGTRRA